MIERGLVEASIMLEYSNFMGFIEAVVGSTSLNRFGWESEACRSPVRDSTPASDDGQQSITSTRYTGKVCIAVRPEECY